MEKFAEEQGNSDRSGRSVWIVAVALFSWLGFSAGTRALTLPDEARYVGIAWSMVQSGDWVIPSLNGFPYFHKPPLFYWLTAVSLHVFGGVQWASRMGTLLGATAGALALWSFARGRSGARLARWTLLVLGTTPLFFAGAQIASPDMLVNGCIAITICLFAEATLRASEGRVSFKLAMSGWAVAALGVLAKGLIGIVIPGLVLAGWLLFTRRLRLWRSLVSPSGIGIFLAIACPWFIAAELSHPGFAKYFFVHHHVERFLGTGFVSARSWWFYVAALPLITLPWSPWLARAVWIGPRPPCQYDLRHLPLRNQ